MWKDQRGCPRCLCHLLVLVALLLFTDTTVVSATTSGTSSVESWDLRLDNLLVENILPDGEIETRVHYKGIIAKDTTTATRLSGDDGVRLREVCDGKHLVQLIYDGEGALKDCEIVLRNHGDVDGRSDGGEGDRYRDEVKTFLNNFKQDFHNLLATSNVTVESLDNRQQLPIKLRQWLDIDQLKESCRQKHRQLKRALNQSRQKHRLSHHSNHHTRSRLRSMRFRSVRRRNRNNRRERSLLIAPGTVWCGLSDNALSYTHLGPMEHTDRCCRRHDHCRFDIPGYAMKYGYYNTGPFTLSHCHCDARRKRDLSEYLRVPGTEWCGKGYSADKYTRLGGFSRTDRCCRMHDTSCPFWIGGFETKYGLFNWRVNTIMHCACDERFRACLKMVDSSDANLVGKLFFNMVQTKCFVLKPKKKCIKRSWWGKCEKHRFVKHAILRDNLPY